MDERKSNDNPKEVDTAFESYFSGMDMNENATFDRNKRWHNSGGAGTPTRFCLGCCRVCDCSGTKGRPLGNKNVKLHNCTKCCKQCREHDNCVTRSISDRISGVFRPRIGQFIGVNHAEASKSGDARHCAPRQRSKNYVPTTEVGLMCYWKYSKWMNKASKRLYKLSSNGTVKVRDKGLYFIYGQTTLNETQVVTNQAMISDDGGRKKEIARCVETAGFMLDPAENVVDKAGSYRTCNMATYVELEAGTEVYLGVFSIGHVSNFASYSSASFGIVKY